MLCSNKPGHPTNSQGVVEPHASGILGDQHTGQPVAKKVEVRVAFVAHVKVATIVSGQAFYVAR
jgi:hypothetical protein